MKLLYLVDSGKSKFLVFDEMPDKISTKYGDDTIIGRIGGIFYDFLAKRNGRREAFGGRKFDIVLDNGKVEKCEGQWWDGTSRLDALNPQPFGFSIYAKPFLKRVIEYGNGETKVEYGRLNTEKGTYAHWLNYVTCISYNRHKPVMEVECNECTSKLFVDMIKSICKISEQIKSFINPEQIKAIAESNESLLSLSNN